MKRYETIVIIDPDLPREAEAPFYDRINDLVPQYQGFLIATDDWGTKKLAYDIRKKNRGHYVRLEFCGDGALVQEMERFFRIDDRIMKYMTVLLDKYADIELIKEEIAKAEVKETEPDQIESDIELTAPDINDSETTEDETTKTTESE